MFIMLIVLVLTIIALFRSFSSIYGFAAEETSFDNSKEADKDSIFAKTDNENDSFSDLFEPAAASKHFREDSDSMFNDQNFSDIINSGYDYLDPCNPIHMIDPCSPYYSMYHLEEAIHGHDPFDPCDPLNTTDPISPYCVLNDDDFADSSSSFDDSFSSGSSFDDSFS